MISQRKTADATEYFTHIIELNTILNLWITSQDDVWLQKCKEKLSSFQTWLLQKDNADIILTAEYVTQLANKFPKSSWVALSKSISAHQGDTSTIARTVSPYFNTLLSSLEKMENFFFEQCHGSMPEQEIEKEKTNAIIQSRNASCRRHIQTAKIRLCLAKLEHIKKRIQELNIKVDFKFTDYKLNEVEENSNNNDASKEIDITKWQSFIELLKLLLDFLEALRNKSRYLLFHKNDGSRPVGVAYLYHSILRVEINLSVDAARHFINLKEVIRIKEYTKRSYALLKLLREITKKEGDRVDQVFEQRMLASIYGRLALCYARENNIAKAVKYTTLLQEVYHTITADDRLQVKTALNISNTCLSIGTKTFQNVTRETTGDRWKPSRIDEYYAAISWFEKSREFLSCAGQALVEQDTSNATEEDKNLFSCEIRFADVEKSKTWEEILKKMNIKYEKCIDSTEHSYFKIKASEIEEKIKMYTMQKMLESFATKVDEATPAILPRVNENDGTQIETKSDRHKQREKERRKISEKKSEKLNEKKLLEPAEIGNMQNSLKAKNMIWKWNDPTFKEKFESKPRRIYSIYDIHTANETTAFSFFSDKCLKVLHNSKKVTDKTSAKVTNEAAKGKRVIAKKRQSGYVIKENYCKLKIFGTDGQSNVRVGGTKVATGVLAKSEKSEQVNERKEYSLYCLDNYKRKGH